MDPTNTHQHSRPPSVDSVNMGSVYSGFYPYNNSGPSSLNFINNNSSSSIPNHQHHTQSYQQPLMGHPFQHPQPGAYPSFQQPLPQQQSYQTVCSATGNYQSGMIPPSQTFPFQTPYYQGGAMYPSYQTEANVFHNSSSSQPKSLPPNLTQISASAAALAALNFQKQQLQQNSSHPQAQAMYGAQQQWPQAVGKFPAMNNQVPPQQMNSTEYYQYYYYLTYYEKFKEYYQSQTQNQQKKTVTPYKHNTHHKVVSFGFTSTTKQQLLALDSNITLALYGLQELFTEKCYPHLFLQSLLFEIDSNLSTGSVIKDFSQTTRPTLLPFSDPQVALDWIRVKQLNDVNMNYELKLIFKVITMLFRQNGIVSGLDLSELLLELVAPIASDDLEKLSLSEQSASKDYYRDSVGHLRQLLMRGQKRVAITNAQNNGLFDHALALAYLFSFISSNNNNEPGSNQSIGQVIDNGLMIQTIRKFINTTLAIDDPLYVFYSHLLQNASAVINFESSGLSTVQQQQTSTSKIDKLESFIILLANDIKFEKIEILDKSYRNLIDLMIALLKNDSNYVLPDELFNNDRFDCLLVNECLDLARFNGHKQNVRLLFHKLEFAFELFDFGFVHHAMNYLRQIKNKLLDNDWDFKALSSDSSFKTSKFAHLMFPISNLQNEDSEMNRQLIQKVWSYQMNKVFCRQSSMAEGLEDSFFDLAEDSELKDIKEISTISEEEDEEDILNKTENSFNEEDEILADETEISEISEKPASKVLDKSLAALVEQTGSADEKQNNNKQQINSTLINPPSSANSTLDNSKVFATLSPIQSNQLSSQQVSQTPKDESRKNNDSQVINQFSRHNPISQNQQLSTRASATLEPIPEVSTQNFPNMQTEFQNSLSEQQQQINNTSRLYNAGDSIDSTLQSSHLTQHRQSISNNIQTPPPSSQPMFFQPHLPSLPDNSGGNSITPPFDFISNGHVTSIPKFDLFSSDQKNQGVEGFSNENSSNISNHKNNEFLSNTNINNNFNTNKTNLNSNNKNKPSETSESNKSSPSKSNNTGLFNTLFGRLKGKNQMILPDDKDPQIVFDPVTKRWVDKSSGNQSEQNRSLPPPPKLPLNSQNFIQSEPSSTLTSPQNSAFPPIPNKNAFPKSMSNDALGNASNNHQSELNNTGDGSVIPPSNQLTNSFGSVISPPFGFNNAGVVGGGGLASSNRNSIRKNRYIDVLQQQKPSVQNSQ